jgi:DNA-binding CsgD family transcriptional regulator
MGLGGWPSLGSGRDRQERRLREVIRGAGHGRGGSVLIDGEPGAGKTAMLMRGIEEAARLGYLIFHGSADEMGQRFPLRTVLACLDTREVERNVARSDLFTTLRSGETPATDGLVVSVAEQVLDLMTRLCATSCVLLAVDDLQWADEASLVVWRRLSRAAQQLPLVLLATSSTPKPGDEEARSAGALVKAGDTEIIRLQPMTPEESSRVIESVLGAPAGPRLRERIGLAEGNPLFIREVVVALAHADGIEISGGTAELTPEAAAGQKPPDTLGAIAERLRLMSPKVLEALRMASLFGIEFSVPELAALTELHPRDLLRVVDDAMTAGLVVDAGERVRFRHTLIREALYESMPASLRSALHRQAAQTLAESGASIERVAEQLLEAGEGVDAWAVNWLTGAADVLIARAPAVGADLVQRAVRQLAPDDPRHPDLDEKLTTAALLLRRPESFAIVRDLWNKAVDPVRRASLAYVLALGLLQQGQFAQGVGVLDQAEQEPGAPPLWTTRMRAVRALTLWSLGDYPEAIALAERTLSEAGTAGDPYAEAYSRHVISLVLLRRRDTPGALAQEELALAASDRYLAAATETARDTDQRTILLINKAVPLASLDRLEEALDTLREAREHAQDSGTYGRIAWVRIAAATVNYWAGHWDTALDDLESASDLPTIDWMPVLRCGVSALILGHRGQSDEAQARLDVMRGRDIHRGVERAYSSYLLMAKSLLAERDGRLEEALDVLLPTLDPEMAADLDQRHRWLPDMVRLALAVGDDSRARATTAICLADAGSSPGHPGRAAAADRCRGLLDTDPEPLLAAIAHYESSARPLALGETLEDLAAVTAVRGDRESARGHLNRAVDTYLTLGAAWDIARADARLRALGVRRGQRTTRRRPSKGWEALTPTELKVTELVWKGLSNPEIAAALFLSRRTVQTHVSHILDKLGVRSRSEVAREAGTYLRPTDR